MKKKGQETGSSAAILLALLGLFVLLYLLFVPPGVRESLLNGNITYANETTTYKASYVLLMDERPGLLNYINLPICQNKECDHDLPSFSLLRTTASQQIASFNPFIVKNNIFTKEDKTLTFSVNDLQDTSNLLLTFGANEHSGTLTVMLNGHDIYQKAMDTYNVEPITIPKTILAMTNTLTFSVSGVGAQFWKTNAYGIENAKIVGDVTDTTKQQSATTFFISSDEIDAMQSADLRFFPDCKASQVGPLSITLNARSIYQGVPDCGMINVVQLSNNALATGDNSLSFQTASGTYLIDSISVQTHLKDINYPVYYFDLSDQQYQDLMQNRTDLNLTLDFAKRLNQSYDVFYNLNGYKRSVQVDQGISEVQSKLLNVALKKKNNWISFEPDGQPVTIAEMKIEIKPRG